ncbi:MAG TPA: lipopolysaccharide heptosyltransferase I [Caldimonas sp.]|nr:lipopolysaccharide heptosyltransferase I [Caldimonas sp.]
MRVLIVKLSSLGDVVHTLPVVADIRAAHPGARVDWVVEPAFAPLVERVAGVANVIECPLRRWARAGWWRATTRSELGAFVGRLRRDRYDAVVELQGLTKAALVAALARGPSWGLANRTDGASHEWPARFLATHAVRVEQHSHALDRARELVAKALDTNIEVPPDFGLRARPLATPERERTVVLVHGTTRVDKLWPDDHWIELGARLVEEGWNVALPRAGADEAKRARLLAEAIGGASCAVWPAMDLGAFIDRLAAAAGVIGVDSGPSHIAVALGLPHVQIYNHPTSWRTGPQPRHGAGLQVSVEDEPTPSVGVVWSAWTRVQECARAAAAARQ